MGPECVLSITSEAENLVRGDRRSSYGPVREGFERMAQIWSGVLGVTVTPQQVALCMIGTKLQRESFRHKRDNLVDMCGYAILCDELAAVEKRPVTNES